MNFGFAMIILFAICAATIGMVFVATQAPASAPVDSFGVTTSNSDNITRGNVTAIVPTGVNIMGYIAIIVAFLVVVIAVVGLMAYSNGTHRSSRW